MPRLLNTRLLGGIGLAFAAIVAATVGLNLWLAHRGDGPSGDDATTAPQWQYSNENGARTAALRSRNRLKEPAPFKGGPATLSIARGPAGYAVRLDVDADMACGYAPTASAVQVSFDNDAPRTFACAPAPGDRDKLLFDGTHSTAYLADPVAFLARLRHARHVHISGDFAGQAASQVMAFDLPPVDPVAEVSPVAAQAVEIPVVATAAPAPIVAPSSKAPAAAGSRRSIYRGASTVRVATRRHAPGYYLHPYRPVRGRVAYRTYY